MPIFACLAPGQERPIGKREIIESLQKERSHLSHQISTYEARFNANETKLARLNLQLTTAEARTKTLSSLLASLKGEINSSDVKHGHDSNGADQDEENGHLLNSVKLLVKACALQATKLDESNSKISNLEQELKVVGDQNEQLTRNNEVLLLRSSSLNDEAEGLRTLNDGQAEQLLVLKQEIEASSRRGESLEAQLAQKDQQFKAASSELLALTDDHQATKQALADVQRKLQAAAGEAEVNKADCVALKLSLGNRESEIERLSGSEAESKQALAASMRKIADLEAHVLSLVKRCKVAEETASGAEAELSATRLLLSESAQAKQGLSLLLEERSQELEEATRRLLLSSSSTKESATGEINRASGVRDQEVEKKLVEASRSLATSALEHQETLTRLSNVQSELQKKDKELMSLRGRFEELEASSISSSLRVHELVAATQQLENLQQVHARTKSELESKTELISSIARLSTAGGRAEAASRSNGGAEDPHGELLQFYNEAVKGESLKIKLRDAPLGLCGSLLSAVSDSSNLRTLVVDLDGGGRNSSDNWEKMGLRTACLAASLALNGSIRSVELTGWSWMGELGDGALPFLPLAYPRPSSSSSLSLLTIDTKLFCSESASSLIDLIKRGLVDLKRPGGKGGVLRIISDNAKVDEWYGASLKSSGDGSGASAAALDGSLSHCGMESHHVVQVMVILACVGGAGSSSARGLKSLRLEGNKIGEGGARLLSLGLSGNPSLALEELNLASNSIGASGAKRLARALSEGVGGKLRRLDVSSQRKELGAGVESLISAVLRRRMQGVGGEGSPCAIEELDISGNQIGAVSVTVIASSFKQHCSQLQSREKERGGQGALLVPLRIIARDCFGLDAIGLKAILAAVKECPGCLWIKD